MSPNPSQRGARPRKGSLGGDGYDRSRLTERGRLCVKLQLDSAKWKVRKRRDPAVGPGVGEGRLSCFADLHHHDLRSGKPPEGRLDGGEMARVLGKVLEVLGKTPAAPEPRESALDHPAARQDDKGFTSSLRLTISMRSNGTFVTARQRAMRCSRYRPRPIRAQGSAGVSCRALTRRRGGPGSRQSGQSPGLSPSCRRRNPPGRLCRPLSADFNDWLSRTAAEGLASRPTRSRSATCSSVQF